MKIDKSSSLEQVAAAVAAALDADPVKAAEYYDKACKASDGEGCHELASPTRRGTASRATPASPRGSTRRPATSALQLRAGRRGSGRALKQVLQEKRALPGGARAPEYRNTIDPENPTIKPKNSRSEMARVGRNDPCPCRSGKKFKSCCLRKAELMVLPARSLPPEIVARMQLENERERRRIERYGHVRPIITAVLNGKRMVGVGSRVFWGEFQTVADALDAYVGVLLEKEWVDAQRARPLEERHPILQWRYRFVESVNKLRTEGLDTKIVTAPATGASSAYFLLAWDLFSLDAYGKLQSQLVKRMKNENEFQGVRHELFALATCVRAGFEIEHHPATAKAKSKTECNAVHVKTGQRITVEAKSRHRHGVLGFKEGSPKAPDEMRPEIRRLMVDAFKKPVTHPYVIFFDLNLPPPAGRQLEWMREIGETLEEAKLRAGFKKNEADPFAFAVVTSYPFHYQLEDMAQTVGRTEVFVLAQAPPASLQHPQVLIEIQKAVEKFGQIPTEFDEPCQPKPG